MLPIYHQFGLKANIAHEYTSNQLSISTPLDQGQK